MLESDAGVGHSNFKNGHVRFFSSADHAASTPFVIMDRYYGSWTVVAESL
jgi:hypothetical protein